MQLKPGVWVLVRALVVMFFVLCALGDVMSTVHLRPMVLCLVFAFGVWLARGELMRVYQGLPPGEQWLMPAWRLSPFQIRQPFQFAHLAGYALAACGFAAELREVIRHDELPAEMPVEMLAGAWGLGLLIGIEWALRAYPASFRQPGGNMPGAHRQTSSIEKVE